jgi:hypothetical protein
MNLKHFSLLLPFAFALTACQDEQQAPTQVEEKAPIVKIDTDNKQKLNAITAEGLNEKKVELQAFIANKACDTSNQCQVIAVGSRACGGPSQYAIYSSKHVNSDEAQALAAKITVAEKSFNEKNDMMSICQHLEEPAAQCVNNVCAKSVKNGDIY